MACKIISVKRGIPIENAQLYLPTDEEIEMMKKGQFLYENQEKLSFPNQKLVNFEYVMD
jgi:hypothetical protein